MRPDLVETLTLGKLEFCDGIPKPETIKSVFDNLDLIRGTTAFLEGIPISSAFALNRCMRDVGIEPNEIAISRNMLASHSLFQTPETQTLYIFSQLDLREGPVVFEAPPETQGLINDAGFRYVAEIGPTDPNHRHNGKYLFLPPEYVDDVPEGYSVFQSETFENRAELRAPLKGTDTEASVEAIKEHLNIYPLALAENPPPEIFHDLTNEELDTRHASNFRFFEELNSVIQTEPRNAFSTELTGAIASIGIKKGQLFDPNERMKAILNEAAAIGNATARVLKFNPRRDNAFAI